LCPAAWKEYFDTAGRPLHVKVGKWFAWQICTLFFNIFPFPQTAGYRRSMVYAGELADKGWNILLFPEGARTVDGELGEFRAGIGVLAKNLRIPIVPVGIVGGEKILLRGRALPRRGEVKLAFGHPFHAPDVSYTEIALQVRAEIVSLIRRLTDDLPSAE